LSGRDERKENESAADDSRSRARAVAPAPSLSLFPSPIHPSHRHALAAKLESTPWGSKADRPFLTREAQYVKGLEAALETYKAARNGELTYDEALSARKLLALPSGFELHLGMFIPTLLSQASPDQQAEWLPKALNLQLVGTYAQTELGHGSYIRGLETLAVHDPSSHSFILHTPALSATKWWPGGLGKTATHAVVMARLFAGGKDRGPHAFIVQVRDLETHKPLAGVTVGDIGDKFGFGSVDNGFLALDHVAVPADRMLSRFASVAPDGAYTPPPPGNEKASYATMVFVRATIVEEAGWVLARAATIAVRYAAVRRQTAPSPGVRESQVLDYQNVSAALLPLVAGAYALIFQGQAAMAQYRAFEVARDRGDFGGLPDLHGLLAGMKALSTWMASDGAEAARRACGGHGYSALSGLPAIFLNYVQNVTWEGDNDVMCLQTARYLVKAFLKAAGGGAGTLSEPVAYLGPAAAAAGRGLAAVGAALAGNAAGTTAPLTTVPPTTAGVVALLRARAGVAVASAAAGLVAASPGGKPVFEGPAWSGRAASLVAAARAHCEAVLASTFLSALDAAEAERSLPPPALTALRRLAALFALRLAADGAGDLLDAGVVGPGWGRSACEAGFSVLAALRPDAVALVDAFGLPDYLLASAIGAADGDVYRRLRQAADRAPFNASDEGPGWAGVLRPLLAPSERAKARAARSRL
jgi:acyl-CoA oxidase